VNAERWWPRSISRRWRGEWIRYLLIYIGGCYGSGFTYRSETLKYSVEENKTGLEYWTTEEGGSRRKPAIRGPLGDAVETRIPTRWCVAYLYPGLNLVQHVQVLNEGFGMAFD
jgi:hypothetical protein